MEHFDASSSDLGHVPGTYPAPGFVGLDSDEDSFGTDLNQQIDTIEAEDNALIAQFGHSAGDGADPTEVPGGTYQPGYEDPAYQFADDLNYQVDAMQGETNAAIEYAEHSPGFGEQTPDAAASLNAFGVADGIRASDYEDFEGQQTDTDADNTVTDGDTAINDAQVALAMPDDSAGE